MAALKKKGSNKMREMYSRHGMPGERAFGVSMADLKVIAKTIKGQHPLACELYETGNLEAMYLAGLVGDGSRMSKKQLDEWAERASDMQMISEYTVPWLATESEHARDLAMKWIKSKKEHVAASGWCTYSGIVATKPDDALDLAEIRTLLEKVGKEIDSAENRVRYTMNGFVIAVGSYVRPLLSQAKATAKNIGVVSVNMGDTACKVPLATASIHKIVTAGLARQKRKTIRVF